MKDFISELVGESKDTLQKGHLNEVFGYYSSDKNLLFPIKKKGSEITAKIDATITNEKILIVSYKEKMMKFKPESVDPDEDGSNYLFNPYSKSEFMDAPKMYSWDLRDAYRETAPSKTMETDDLKSSDNKKATTVSYMMGQYNDYARKVIDCMKEVKIAETLKQGIEQNKTYNLPVRIAASLGF